MAKITMDQIASLRDATGAPVIRVKKVLEQFEGNVKKAEVLLRKEGFEKAAKRAGRTTSQGVIASYVHHSKKVASMVTLLCETDFVAKNDMFIDLGNNLAMQIASMNPKNVKELEGQDFIKDPSKKVLDLVKEVIAKTGENIQIGKIIRFAIGE